MPCNQRVLYSLVLEGLDRKLLEETLRQLGFKGSRLSMLRNSERVEMGAGNQVKLFAPDASSTAGLASEIKRAYAATALQRAAKLMGWQVRGGQKKYVLERR